MLDQRFFEPFEPGEVDQAIALGLERGGPGFEAAMDAVRRVYRELDFRIGVQVMSGRASARRAGPAYAALADACIRALAPAALAEIERLAGGFPGDVAVVALGKCGSREMTAGSDPDLMTIYQSRVPTGQSVLKGWSADTFYARFTQRLIAALSAPTGEGGLYEVDMRLRPSGTAGPVAVSLAAFRSYYAGEAETWEFLALTRARVVWSSSDGFSAEVAKSVETALRKPRDRAVTAREVLEMRALMAYEKPPSGFWDMKPAPGGLVDVEFAAQFLQIAEAAGGGPLRSNTGEALEALDAAGLADPGALARVEAAWRLQQDLSQVLKVALTEAGDPEAEPKAFQTLLARAGGARTFAQLKVKLGASRQAVRAALGSLIPGAAPTE